MITLTEQIQYQEIHCNIVMMPGLLTKGRLDGLACLEEGIIPTGVST